MSKRIVISAAELYVKLDREFRRRQSPECETCYIQLPFRVDRQDDTVCNWEIVPPPRCSQGCLELIDELVAHYAPLYDLASGEERDS
jgi:hypothetical protein